MGRDIDQMVENLCCSRFSSQYPWERREKRMDGGRERWRERGRKRKREEERRKKVMEGKIQKKI